jgi:5-methylthioadenosine/S-adenosylhomocysteine deaminase
MREVDIIISGGRVVQLDEKDSRLDSGSITIDGDKIIAIGKANEIEKQFVGKKVINASGCLVMPGLINCHTHAAMTCFR